MPLHRQAIPSLLNGVSQQPASLRHTSQAEAVENCLSSLAVGLQKRPAFEHVAKLSDAPVGHTPAYHVINRDTSERYVVTLREWAIDVYDLVAQASVSVAYEDGDYASLVLASSHVQGDAFRVAVPAGESVTLTTTNSPGSTVVWQSSVDADFTAPTTLRTDTTTTSATISWDPATQNGLYVRARVSSGTAVDVAATIECKNIGYLADDDGDMRTALRLTTVADYTFIVNSNTTVRLLSQVTGAGTLSGTVQTFSDLPGAPTTGNIYAIVGDESNNFDTYYVRYSGSVWEEWFRPGLANALDTATMPHTLTRLADGTFSFQRGSWLSRTVGDSDSAPAPKFVGSAIHHIVFYRNRLGMLAGEYITLSRVGNSAGGYFSFWPPSVQTVLDSGPIDLGMAHSRVASLQYGVVFNESLLLFSEQTQFVLTAQGALTPSAAKVDPTTEFSASRTAPPAAVGNNAYFAVAGGDFDQIREYFIDSDSAVNDAADVTAHVPRYIPEGTHCLVGSSNQDLLIALTSGDPDALYTYRFFWDGNDKAQSAWSRWTLTDSPVLHRAEFIESVLWLVAEYADGVYLLKLPFNADAAEPTMGMTVNLDRRTSLTGVYSAGTDLTTWTTPYDVVTPAQVVLGSGFGTSRGVTPNIAQATATTITAPGDYSAAAAWVGLPYTQRYHFSEQFVRKAGQRGSPDSTQIGGRLQLRRFTVRFVDTGYFEAQVTPGGRDTNTYKFTGNSVGLTVLGELNKYTGTFAFDVYARSGDVVIELVNDTWKPATFLSGSWDGMYSPRAVLPFAGG